jgi:hypothetical protein
MVTWTVRLAWLTAMAAAASSVSAQNTYRCTTATASWTSDQPCDFSRPRAGAAASTNRAPPLAPRVPSTDLPVTSRAAEHLSYMSAPCAELAEALRTGPARGLRADTLRDLENDFRKRCSEDEQRAKQLLSVDQQRQRDQAAARETAEQAERSRSATTQEQCSEMLRILHSRRQRASTFNSGEKADLEHFESNYRSRCVPA